MSFGIDFGTSNSAVVFNGVQRIDTGDGQPFPSVVAIDSNAGDDVVAGPDARRKRLELEGQDYVVVSSVKRHLLDDRPLPSIQGKQWTSVEVAAELFKALRRLTIQKLGGKQDLTSAVVSVPVGFKAAARRRLREAAGRAGIHVTDFVHEPTAAYFHVRDECPQAARLAVFDWGGGTLDVSILDVHGDEVYEVATGGLEQAGDAIDDALARWVHEQAVGPDVPPSQASVRQRDQLRAIVERAKIDLAQQQKTSVSLSYLNGLLDVDVARATLDRLAAPLIDRAIATLRRAVEEAERVAGERPLEVILLVGGSSKLASLRPRLEAAFPNAVVFPPKLPQWATAQGASLLADQIGAGGGQLPYRLASPVVLVQSDATPMPLVGVGDAFDDAWRRHHVGIVEETDHAQLVFAVPPDDAAGGMIDDDASRPARPIGYLAVPMQGFGRERLRVESRLTRDLTLEVRAQSEAGQNHLDDHWSRWDYGKLRFAYQLPRRACKLSAAAPTTGDLPFVKTTEAT